MTVLFFDTHFVPHHGTTTKTRHCVTYIYIYSITQNINHPKMTTHHSTTRTFSPLDCLPHGQCTPSGLLQKHPNEIELYTVSSIDLCLDDHANKDDYVPLNEQDEMILVNTQHNQHNIEWKESSDNLRLLLTTHRIVFWPTNQHTISRPRFLPHSHTLQGTSTKSSKQQQQRKLLLSSFFPKEYWEIVTTYTGIFRIRFSNATSRDSFHTHLQQALQRKSYEWDNDNKHKKNMDHHHHQNNINNTTTTTKNNNTSIVGGMDAVLKTSEWKHQEASELTNHAFSENMDPEAFLQETSKLIQVIQKYVATLDKHDNHDNDTGTTEQKELRHMLRDMGVLTSSAIHKSDFDNPEDYYLQLAREIADFVHPKLSDGMMTLTDLYCLYNRARGFSASQTSSSSSSLISPDDFVQAIDQLSNVEGLNLSSRVFETSGLVVVQDNSQVNDLERVERLVEHCRRNGAGVTLHQAAAFWNLSNVWLVQEILWLGERLGYLVRDDDGDTRLPVRYYYPNLYFQ